LEYGERWGRPIRKASIRQYYRRKCSLYECLECENSTSG